MKLESQGLLWNMLQALQAVLKFVKDTSLEEYRGNPMMRAAVEREFITLGEALRRLEGSEPQVAQQIGDRAKIVAFRNVLVHDYERVSDDAVWATIQNDVKPLALQIEKLLGEPETET